MLKSAKYNLATPLKPLSFDKGYIIWLVYLLGSLALLLHHEIWKDEAHHWLLARDSSSLTDLIHNGRYEGHPLLWNIVLYYITRFTQDPLFMQLAHWTIAAMSMWLLIFKSKLPVWLRYMLPFTYLFFYEYQAISRNYALCILFLFIICDLLSRENIRYTRLALFLFLLANTHLFGLVIASGVCLVVLYNHFDRSRYRFNLRPIMVFCIICLIGFALSVYQIIPPSDHFLTANHNDAGLFSATRINKLLSIFFRGVFHVPNILESSVWNSNLLFFYIPDVLKAILSMVVWLLPLLLFRQQKKLLFLFFFSGLSISFFAYISPLLLAVRHSGFLFILLVCALWLNHSKVFTTAGISPIKRYPKIIFSILVLGIISSGLMSYTALSRPFSQSKKVKEYIVKNQLESLTVASTQNTGPSLSAYLQQPLYYSDKRGMGSYAIWNTGSFVMDRSIIDQNLMEFAQTQNEFLIASEYEYDRDFLGDCWEVLHLGSFSGSIVKSEQFVLYRAHKTCD